MVNLVQRLQETKAFVRMSSGLDLKKYGWYGDGTGTNENTHEILNQTTGIVQDSNGELHFTDWNCRWPEQCNHPHRRHGRALKGRREKFRGLTAKV
jgi:hypothetical protein